MPVTKVATSAAGDVHSRLGSARAELAAVVVEPVRERRVEDDRAEDLDRQHDEDDRRGSACRRSATRSSCPRRGSRRSRAGASCGAFTSLPSNGFRTVLQRDGRRVRDGLDPETGLDAETQERIDDPVPAEAERETRLTPAEAVARMRINVPVRGNRKLAQRDRAREPRRAAQGLVARRERERGRARWRSTTTPGCTSRSSRTSRSSSCASSRSTGSSRPWSRDYGMTRADAEVVVDALRAHALRRHVGAPPRPRGLQPLPRRAEAARAARRHLRRSPT